MMGAMASVISRHARWILIVQPSVTDKDFVSEAHLSEFPRELIWSDASEGRRKSGITELRSHKATAAYARLRGLMSFVYLAASDPVNN